MVTLNSINISLDGRLDKKLFLPLTGDELLSLILEQSVAVSNSITAHPAKESVVVKIGF